MNKRIAYLHLIILVIAGTACNKDFISRDFPTVLTLSIAEGKDGSIEFTGELILRDARPVSEVGFVWQQGSEPDINTGFKANLSGTIKQGRFQIRVNNSINKDTKYYLRAYAVSGNLIIYGDLWEFTSIVGLKPSPFEFTPISGQVGDTIIIKGGLYSKDITKNSVRFNGLNAEIVSLSDSAIICIVPWNLEAKESEVFLTCEDQTTVTSQKFSLQAPVVSSVNPDEVKVLDTIIINGTGFHRLIDYNKVFVGSVQAIIVALTPGTITATVPFTADSLCFVNVVVSGQSGSSSEKIKVRLPDFSFFTPTRANYLDTVSIYAKNLDPGIISSIYFGDHAARIIDISGKRIRIEVPVNLNIEISDIIIKFNSGQHVMTEKFILAQPEVESAFPENIKYGGIITVRGKNFNPQPELNEVYITKGGILYRMVPFYSSRDSIKFELYNHESPHTYLDLTEFYIGVRTCENIVWETTPSYVTTSWSRCSDFPGLPRYKASSFSVSGKAYIGFGTSSGGQVHKDLWEYTPATDLWARKSDLPGVARSYARSFNSTVKGYAGAGFTADNSSGIQLYDFYSYTPQSDTWTRITDYPDLNPSLYVGNTASTGSRCFASLAGNSQTMRELINDDWIAVQIPLELSQAPASGVLAFEDKFYIIVGYKTDNSYSNKVWEYNINTNIWTRKSDFPGNPRYAPASFVIDNYGYYGCGMSTDHLQYKDMWRYDPSTDKWIKLEDFPGGLRSHLTSLSTGDSGFVGLGLYYSPTTLHKDFWRYYPR